MLPTIWESVSFPPADPYCALGLLIWSLAGAPVVGFRPQSPLLASFWSVSLDVAEMIRAGVPSALKQRMSHEPKLLLELCTGGFGETRQGTPWAVSAAASRRAVCSGVSLRFVVSVAVTFPLAKATTARIVPPPDAFTPSKSET